MSIFIGGAWPYANGSLHLGHVASLLPGDILARYYRLQGEKVLYVSGSDCHGTPISIRANQEGVSPQEISERYHKEFAECFHKLGFSYDLYTRTDDPFHHQTVQQIFLQLLDNGYIYKKAVGQTYCETCARFLPDRYVEGQCPHCGNRARGDQCDHCSSLLDPSDLLGKQCKLCRSSPATRQAEHYFLALSKFQKQLEKYVNEASGWRENAVHLTRRYLDEGLHDRAATRDLLWGVDVPLQGHEGKKIYVWIEAVSGYLSASMKWAQQTGGSWETYWSEKTTAYYVHGKDNIPFHTLILPAILLGIGNLHLPDRIISGEYLTLEGRKISTSQNWAVWVPDVLQRYEPDSLRYFLTINGPENRDADFSWREFIYSHNGELLGAFGNFVNRSLKFIVNSLDGRIPSGRMDERIKSELLNLYSQTGRRIETGKLKEALEGVFAFIRGANKFFDERKPWVQLTEDYESCAATLYTCSQIIVNLANLLEPFLPFACQRIRSFLAIPQPEWQYTELRPSTPVHKVEHLFTRIDVSVIAEELGRLSAQKSE
ncbi:methionine--tRNA ligase [Paenibacillus sp. J2TS4]|uniref:methionine--tRNA ligase n=1 Tax=Paenibacillus sp. J2TS4 TaxID=2807194 RepID=UPI001B2AE6BB|nr:methionine--tRNA ligase [Paenibacillus sp. J2TS4]GIP34177.1 methionine--tRNA ligase 1 [Paenibacillus sp. J2TS4]